MRLVSHIGLGVDIDAGLSYPGGEYGVLQGAWPDKYVIGI